MASGCASASCWMAACRALREAASLGKQARKTWACRQMGSAQGQAAEALGLSESESERLTLTVQGENFCTPSWDARDSRMELRAKCSYMPDSTQTQHS